MTVTPDITGMAPPVQPDVFAHSAPPVAASPRRRLPWLLALCLTTAGAVLPAVASLNQPQPFNASVTLSVRQRDGRTDAGALSEAISHLRSDITLGRAVDLAQLDRDPEFTGGRVSGAAVALELLAGKGAKPTDSRRRAIAELARQIGFDMKPDVASLLVRASSSAKSLKIAEALATVFAARSDTTGTVPEDASKRRLEAAEAALATFRARPDSIALSDALALRSRIDGLKSHLARLRETPSEATSQTAQDAGLAAAHQAYLNARLTVNRLAVSLGPRHPAFVAAKADAEAARLALAARQQKARTSAAKMEASRLASASAVEADLDRLKRQLSGLHVDLDAYDRLVAGVAEAHHSFLSPRDPEAKASAPTYEASAPRLLARSEKHPLPVEMLLGGLCGLGAALAFGLSRPSRDHAPLPAALVPQPEPVRFVRAENSRPVCVDRVHHAANRPAADAAKADLPAEEAVPTVVKLRRVAPHVFTDDAAITEVDRLRLELAELRERVLARAATAI